MWKTDFGSGSSLACALSILPPDPQPSHRLPSPSLAPETSSSWGTSSTSTSTSRSSRATRGTSAYGQNDYRDNVHAANIYKMATADGVQGLPLDTFTKAAHRAGAQVFHGIR